MSSFITPSPTFQSGHPGGSLKHTSHLYSGFGVASNYTWKEEAFEIDVTVQVPAETRAKNIKFEAKPHAIDLRYIDENSNEVVLLDVKRKLRGRVNLDGTYWVLSDYSDKERSVTVTIEKLQISPRDDFQVVDYDWKGVYADDDEEVVERFYDKPESLDVREYAASLGVDIDNINMSLVDKSMFSSGVNLTQSSLDELTKAGYLAEDEVTIQADGTEYKTTEDGSLEKISDGGFKPPIPLLDDDDGNTWNQAVPVTRDAKTNETVVRQVRSFTRAAFAADSAIESESTESQRMKETKDPIDALTVKRLKEILKQQGLKTTGNKAELQDRLRAKVNALLQGKQE